MLPKVKRLPIHKFVGRKGKIVKTRFFNLKIFPPAENFARLGVIIGKKLAKKAYLRNAIKRKIFRIAGNLYNFLPKADYIIIAKPAIKEVDDKIIEQELKNIFNDISV